MGKKHYLELTHIRNVRSHLLKDKGGELFSEAEL